MLWEGEEFVTPLRATKHKDDPFALHQLINEFLLPVKGHYSDMNYTSLVLIYNMMIRRRRKSVGAPSRAAGRCERRRTRASGLAWSGLVCRRFQRFMSPSDRSFSSALLLSWALFYPSGCGFADAPCGVAVEFEARVG